MDNKAILDDIINIEWKQFTNAKNIGSRSYCQDNKINFISSRKAYWSIYNEEIRKLYLKNLIENDDKGIKLVEQKYAYMMRDTAPEYFNMIQENLISVSVYKELIVSLIMDICKDWLDEIEKSMKDNVVRPIYKSDNSIKITSAQTYLNGEYLSYSENTLVAILIYFIENFLQKNNLLIKNIEELKKYT